MKKVFLGIGTNLGDRENNLREAIMRIENNIGRILSVSYVYETSPWGFNTEADFLNMAAAVETEYSPSVLMDRVMIVESLLGRVRSGKKYSSRVIDIDILIYEDQIIDEPYIKIPHPLMHERRFVLVPLCDISSSALHPVLKVTFASLLAVCKDQGKVEKYKLNLKL
jgi:2-amino-4-hydroxy-6-hydroxymethyldihydropteridine diphosphokinase